MLVDYHVHGMGHGAYAHTPDELGEYMKQAVTRNIKEIGFAEHDWYINEINRPALAAVQADWPQIAIRIGLEVDYFVDKETEIAGWLANRPFDYVIGSVHHIGDWNFDNPEFVAEYANRDSDELYQTYFALVARLARSRLFDLIGHLDLIKVFGCRPRRQVGEMIAPLLKIIRESELVVEINTAGRYKPVAEVYPSEEILAACFAHNIPITLSSDAHEPGQVGRDIAWAAELARRVGYRRIATFAKRKVRMVEL